MNQLRQFKEKISNDLGEDYFSKNLVLMGDSNCPTSMKGLRPKCYGYMKRLLPVVNSDQTQYTYPAYGSTVWENAYQVKIDHVQASPDLSIKTRTLAVEGSDHRAIEVEID